MSLIQLKHEEIVASLNSRAEVILNAKLKYPTPGELRRHSEAKQREIYDVYKSKIDDFWKIIGNSSDISSRVSRDDVDDFFQMLSYNCGKQTLQDLQKRDLIRGLEKYVYGKPRRFQFYFGVGEARKYPPSTLMTGYKIGYGRLVPFAKVPEIIKKRLFLEASRKDIKTDQEKEEFDQFKQSNKEWFLEILVNALGRRKATEIAILLARRTFNIYNFFSHLQSFKNEELLGPNSPSEYSYCSNFFKLSGGSSRWHSEPAPWIIVKYFEPEYSKLTQICKSSSQSEIEEALLYAIDSYGLIDESTPLHVRFMLCIIALEELLLGDIENENLSLRLSERVALLLGNEPAWMMTTYELDNRKVLTKKFQAEKFAESRIRLFHAFKDLYDKRSKFAHAGLKKKKSKQEITEADFHLAFSILSWSVHYLTRMRKKYTHFARKNETDTSYLEKYFEDLKFS